MIFQVVQASKGWSLEYITKKVPWAVVLAMVSDQGKLNRKKEDEPDIIETEEEELDFLGLS